MRPITQPIYTCPFCTGGAGVIAVDLSRLTDGYDTIAAAQGIGVADDPRRPMIVFDPVDPPGRQCPHLLLLAIDGVARRLHGFRPVVPRTFERAFAHPAVTDAGRAMLLYYAANRSADYGCYPRAAHQVHQIGLDLTFAGQPWQGRLRGWIVVALQPGMFLPELEWREQQDRNGQCGGGRCRNCQHCTSV